MFEKNENKLKGRGWPTFWENKKKGVFQKCIWVVLIKSCFNFQSNVGNNKSTKKAFNGPAVVTFANPAEAFLDGLRLKKCLRPFSKAVRSIEGAFVEDQLEVVILAFFFTLLSFGPISFFILWLKNIFQHSAVASNDR